MPEALWKNWPKNVLAYSCFLVVALLLVELSVASSDIVSLAVGQLQVGEDLEKIGAGQ